MVDPNSVEKTALTITRAVGSPLSITIHSILFIICFGLAFSGYISFDRMLLILTTIVSLEAIYLAIFIQMTLNYTTQSIEEVAEDIGEIQEDVGEIQEDVEEITEEEAEEEVAEEQRKTEQRNTLATIQNDLRKLMQDIEKLQRK